MKIDAHMHLTQPLNLLTDQLRRCGFDRGIICSSAVARGECIRTLTDAEDMMNRVAAAQSSPVTRTASEINRDIATAVRQAPDLLWGLGKADLFQREVGAAIWEIAGLGLVGVGEIVGLHRHVNRLSPILETAAAAGLPVFLHTVYPVDAEDLAEIEKLLLRIPDVQVVLGHMGGDFWLEAIAMAERLPNVWLDTSEVVNQVALQVAVNTVPDRVLFSTDFPWDAPESMEARVECLHNDDTVRKAVLGDNAMRLFGKRKGGAMA